MPKPNQVSYIHSDTVEDLLRSINVCVIMMKYDKDKDDAINYYIDTMDLLYSAIFGHGMGPNQILRVFEPHITREERNNVRGT